MTAVGKGLLMASLLRGRPNTLHLEWWQIWWQERGPWGTSERLSFFVHQQLADPSSHSPEFESLARTLVGQMKQAEGALTIRRFDSRGCGTFA
jgi:hypothetical protein